MSPPRPLCLLHADFARLVAPFVAREVLSLADVHVVDRLAALGAERDAEVLLGLAFAVRAPRVGHIGVDLATIARSLASEAGAARGLAAADADADADAAGDEAPLRWPASVGVAACAACAARSWTSSTSTRSTPRTDT